MVKNDTLDWNKNIYMQNQEKEYHPQMTIKIKNTEKDGKKSNNMADVLDNFGNQSKI